MWGEVRSGEGKGSPLQKAPTQGAGPTQKPEDPIADILGRKVTALGPTRAQLIAKGMIWSPSHGDTAFTVPLFDAFMQRIMPGEEWRE